MERLRRHIDKAGIIGVTSSHLCCIGLGVRVGLIAPAVSGFLMNQKFLMPFLFISLTASVSGIFFSYLKHENILPLLISVISSIIIITFSFTIHVAALFYLGLTGLIGASIYNIICAKKIKN